jgi:hypothetical protein
VRRIFAELGRDPGSAIGDDNFRRVATISRIEGNRAAAARFESSVDEVRDGLLYTSPAADD